MNTRLDLFFQQLHYFHVTLITNANAAHGIDAVLARVKQGLHYPPTPHATSFVIGTAVINTHIQWVASESYQGNTCCR
jgi:hypothetical protein